MSVLERITANAAKLPPAQQERVLEVIDILQKRIDDEDRAWGEVGMQLMAQTLEPEDFSDWWEKKPNG